MLKLRVITALVLFFIAVYGIFFLSNVAFSLALGVIMLFAAYEWAGLAQFPSLPAKIAFIVIVATFIFSLWLLKFMLAPSVMNTLALFFGGLALLLLATFPERLKFWHNNTLIIAIFGCFLLLLTWNALVSIHAIESLQWGRLTMTGPFLLFFMLMLVWVADTGAYFAGKKFGKNKLAPKISPGKSREGVYGGLILALILVTIFSLYAKMNGQDYGFIIALSSITVISSVLGDLLESMFKRQANIKDSGRLLPGHGGLLDRIDSITVAAPVFYILLCTFYVFK